MESKPRGIAVIISNEKFGKHRRRVGTNEDADSLQKLFSWLGFDTRPTYKDLTGRQMRQTLKDIACVDHSNYDCLMVAILSHGGKGDVVCGKSGTISIKTIIEVFNDKDCPSLAGKPKIFILQACRGKRANIGVKPDNANKDDVDSDEYGDDDTDEDDDEGEDDEIDEGDDVPDVGPAVHPNISDYMVAYSTVPDHVAFLNNRTGSIFITELEKKFRRHATNEDVITILERVINEVTQYQPKSSDLELRNSRQSPEVRYSLKGKIYFNPSPVKL